MRRWIAIIAVFLLLGAIVNIAVAWGCAMFIEPDWRMRGSSWTYLSFSGRAHQDQDRIFQGAHRWQRAGAMRVRTQFYYAWSGLPPHSPGPSFAEVVPEWCHSFVDAPWRVSKELGLEEVVKEPVEKLIDFSSHVDARGWPCLALWGGMKIQASGQIVMVDGQTLILEPMEYWIIPLDSTPTPAAEGRWLPLRPILPGFVINTLFYALLLWLLFFAPFATRRMLRRRRGLCEKCAYPIGTWGGSPVCTECGAAVPRSVEATHHRASGT